MAKRSDRAFKEPLAMRLYAEGETLRSIAKKLKISAGTLQKWKADNAVPGTGKSDWDKLRQEKLTFVRRLRDLFERQLEFMEKLDPDELSPPMTDTLSKLGSLAERWNELERETVVGQISDRPKQFLGHVRWIAEYLKENDPEGLKVFAANFDAMVLKFKTEEMKPDAPKT